MAAPVRLVGGVRRRLSPRDDVPEFHLLVKVGKSQTLRAVPLTEAELFVLVKDSAAILDMRRREREGSGGWEP